MLFICVSVQQAYQTIVTWNVEMSFILSLYFLEHNTYERRLFNIIEL